MSKLLVKLLKKHCKWKGVLYFCKDGIERKLLQTKGAVNGKDGIFEYIINEKGQVSHQTFVAGGRITGKINGQTTGVIE